ncbi:MAG: hypothetical protein ETSY1_40765 [Candidatus Entotheonella factor]|uniref:Uncharacterized protein n=1 Tax=Entotheonella factor TaxID=1429438 RepID=W4L6V1_ENTF1|nr:MAG: hypothetical protein ETSY1_40765 [Candidatus Entotheonella factor]
MSEASGTGRPKPRLPELAFQACFEPPAMTLGDYRIACAVLRALGEPLPLGRPTRPTCIRALALSLAKVWPGEAAKAQAQLQQAFGFFARIEPEPSVLDLGAMPPGKLDEAAAEGTSEPETSEE